MTPTDKLRALLDEMGVEWQDFDGEPTWMDSDGRMHYARYEFTFNGPTDELTVYHLTPEQAIAATVGVGTCHTVGMNPFGNPPYNQSGLRGNSMECGCSECGAPWSTMGIFRGNKIKHNFKACPICGRKVVK